jgi:hypothetical protein
VKQFLNKQEEEKNLDTIKNLNRKIANLLNIKSEHIENVFVIKLNELLMDLLIEKQEFQEAIKIANKINYEYLLFFLLFRLKKKIKYLFIYS